MDRWHELGSPSSGDAGTGISRTTDAEILALAISNEEQASAAYSGFAEILRDNYPDTARMFSETATEETGHRHQLTALFQSKFGEAIPAINAGDVQGLLQERPSGSMKFHGPDGMRREARRMEANASRFYHQAASRTLDVTIRNVFGDPAVAEAAHERTAGEVDGNKPPNEARVQETDDARRGPGVDGGHLAALPGLPLGRRDRLQVLHILDKLDKLEYLCVRR